LKLLPGLLERASPPLDTFEPGVLQYYTVEYVILFLKKFKKKFIILLTIKTFAVIISRK